MSVPYLFLKKRRRSPASEALWEAPTFHLQRKVTMSAEAQPARCGVWGWTVDKTEIKIIAGLIVSDTSSIGFAPFFSLCVKKNPTLATLFLFPEKSSAFSGTGSKTPPLGERLLFLEVVFYGPSSERRSPGGHCLSRNTLLRCCIPSTHT